MHPSAYNTEVMWCGDMWGYFKFNINYTKSSET